MIFRYIIAENEEAWKVYKMWCVLPATVKDCWIEAAKTIHAYDELAKTIPDKVGKLFFKIIFCFVCISMILFNHR